MEGDYLQVYYVGESPHMLSMRSGAYVELTVPKQTESHIIDYFLIWKVLMWN